MPSLSPISRLISSERVEHGQRVVPSAQDLVDKAEVSQTGGDAPLVLELFLYLDGCLVVLYCLLELVLAVGDHPIRV